MVERKNAFYCQRFFYNEKLFFVSDDPLKENWDGSIVNMQPVNIVSKGKYKAKE